MTATTLLAGGAGTAAVLALADLVAAAQGGELGTAARRLLAPWRAAGRDGRVTDRDRRRLGVVCGGTTAAAAWILAGPAVAALCAIVGPTVVSRALAARRARWRRRAADGVAHLARALADPLSGGHSLRGAVLAASASGSVGGATGAELRSLARELQLGRPTSHALEDWGARLRSPGTDVLVAALLLQRDAGGNLAGLLREIAGDLEDARRATADARTATAQARLTARIVAGLPVAALVLGEATAPGTVGAMLGSQLAQLMAAAAALLTVSALVLVRQLAQVPA